MHAKRRKRPFSSKRLLKNILKGIAVGIFFLFVSWTVGFAWFSGQVPRSINFKNYGDADAIVVLTGGSSRLDSGFFLFRNHVANKLFISGVGKGVSLRDLLAVSGMKEEQVSDILSRENDIVLGFNALSTKGNAEEAGEWVRKNGYTRIYLVTASYHMPRALLEFKRSMPDIIFYPYPTFPDNYHPGEWWKHMQSFKFLRSEYNKYIAALFWITAVDK